MSDLLHITRRQAIQQGLGSAVAMSLGSQLAWADAPPLLTKAIPSSGEQLPVIGIGTNSFREAGLTELSEMMRRMNALGGKVIDTAPIYGESEGVIGKILQTLGKRSDFFIASKITNGRMNFGPPPTAAGNAPTGMPAGGPPPGMNMNVPSGLASLEQSLQRLQLDHLDLLQIHSLMGVDELMPQLREWKQAGRIRYIGMTTSNNEQHQQMAEYMKKYPVDFVQVDYSIENRNAEKALLPLAIERKIAVLVNTPFGGRGGRTLLSATQRELPKWAADYQITSWGQFLLKFVVSHPAVTAAIPGSTKLKHLEDNQAAGRGRMPDADARKRMQEYWSNQGS